MSSQTTLPGWLRGLIVFSCIAAWALVFFVVVAPYLDFWIFKQPTGDVGDQLLQVVLWSITIVFTVAGAILGLNWYQGERRHQEQVDALNQIEADMRMSIDRFTQELGAVRDDVAQLSNAVEFLQRDLGGTMLTAEGLQNSMDTKHAKQLAASYIVQIDAAIDHFKSLAHLMDNDDVFSMEMDQYLGFTDQMVANFGPLEVKTPKELLRKLEELAEVFGALEPSRRATIDRLIGALQRQVPADRSPH